MTGRGEWFWIVKIFDIAARRDELSRQENGVIGLGGAPLASEADAKMVKVALANRLQECGLEMHPVKTMIGGVRGRRE